jgi:hypothetical protein
MTDAPTFVCIPKLCDSPDCKWNRQRREAEHRPIPPGECAHPEGPQVASLTGDKP